MNIIKNVQIRKQIQNANMTQMKSKRLKIVKLYIFYNRKKMILKVFVNCQGKDNMSNLNLRQFVNLKDIKLNMDIAQMEKIKHVRGFKLIQHNLQNM